MGQPLLNLTGGDDAPWNAARPGRPLPPPPAHMALHQVAYKLPPIADRQKMRSEFNRVGRPAFLAWLAAHRKKELLAAGIDEDQIKTMVKEGNAPPGWNVHHKLPIAGGGTNEIGNLVLIRELPHVELHQFLHPQVKHLQPGQTAQVWLPVPDGVIFPPPAPPALPAPPTRKMLGPGLRLAP